MGSHIVFISMLGLLNSPVKPIIPEEDRRAYRPKRCTNNNEDGDNSPNNADNTNHQASSQTFRETKLLIVLTVLSEL